MKNKKWRVVQGFDEAGDLLAYYVVRGQGTDPKELEFDHHGAYILKTAAKETCDALNENSKLYGEILHRYAGATLKRVGAA